MAAPELVTIGEAFEDLIFYDLDRLPRPGEEITTPTFVRTVGGGAVITAIAAARLGAGCRIVSGLSAAAVARLRRERVKVFNLRRAGEPHAVTAALSTAAHRTFVTFNGVNDRLEPRLLAAAGRVRGRHVHLACYPRRCDRWTTIVESLRARGISTSWDFGWNEALLRDRRFPGLVAALDVVFFNEQEARLYARRASLRAASAYWRTHGRTVVIKMGARGSRWMSADGIVEAPSRRVRAIDTTGAGDAFNGGFLCARLRQRTPRQCLDIGNYVGAMSTRAAGGIDALPRAFEMPQALQVRGS